MGRKREGCFGSWAAAPNVRGGMPARTLGEHNFFWRSGAGPFAMGRVYLATQRTRMSFRFWKPFGPQNKTDILKQRRSGIPFRSQRRIVLLSAWACSSNQAAADGLA